MKAIKQYFPVALFIMLYKMLKSCHSTIQSVALEGTYLKWHYYCFNRSKP